MIIHEDVPIFYMLMKCHATLIITLQKKWKFVEMIRKEIKIQMGVQERNQKDKILYTPDMGSEIISFSPALYA